MKLRSLQTSLLDQTRQGQKDAYARLHQADQARESQDTEPAHACTPPSDQMTPSSQGDVDWEWLSQAKQPAATSSTQEAPAASPSDCAEPDWEWLAQAKQPGATSSPQAASAARPSDPAAADWEWLSQAKASASESLARQATAADAPQASTSALSLDDWLISDPAAHHTDQGPSASSAPEGPSPGSPAGTSPGDDMVDHRVQNLGSIAWSQDYFSDDGKTSDDDYEGYMSSLLSRKESYYRNEQWAWLNNRMDELADTIDNGPTQLSQLQDRQTALVDERSNLGYEHESNDSEINRCQSQINDLNFQVEELHNSPEAQAKVEEARREIDRIKQEIERLKTQQQNNEMRASSIQQELDSGNVYTPWPKDKLRQLHNDHDDTAEKIRLRNQDLETAQFTYEQASRDAAQDQTMNQRWQLQNQVSDLQQKLSSLQNRQGQIDDRVSNINYELTQLSDKISQKRTEIDKAKEEWYTRNQQRKALGFTLD